METRTDKFPFDSYIYTTSSIISQVLEPYMLVVSGTSQLDSADQRDRSAKEIFIVLHAKLNVSELRPE